MQIEINGMIAECDPIAINALMASASKIGRQAGELEQLRAQVAELEQLATVQSDNLQKYAAFEATWNRKQSELRAERDDLAARLVALVERLLNEAGEMERPHVVGGPRSRSLFLRRLREELSSVDVLVPARGGRK